MGSERDLAHRPGCRRPGLPRSRWDRLARVDEITTTDYHTAGEPFRIVTAGVPEIPGATVAERREYAPRTPAVDAVRRLLWRRER